MKLKKIFSIVLAGLLLVLILFFLARNFLLHQVLNKLSGKLISDYQLELTTGNSDFTGIFTVEMNDITLRQPGGDTLLHLDTLSAAPSIGSLFLFTLRMKTLEMKSGFIYLICTDSSCNYSTLLTKKKTAESTRATGNNYAALFHRLFSKIFDLAPQNAVLHDLRLSFITDTFQTDVRIPDFHSSPEIMEGDMEDALQNRHWKMTGNFDQQKRKYDALIYPLENHSRFPLLRELFDQVAL